MNDPLSFLAGFPAVTHGLTFLQFCARLGVTLTPGQRAIARVAYDGEVPDDDVAREIFGDLQHVPQLARRTIVLVCGARAGKSYVLVALRLLWGALVRDLSSLAPGQHAVALIVAPRLEDAEESLAYVKGAAHSVSWIHVIQEDTSGLEILRQDGKRVRIQVLPASADGRALRGRSYTDVCLDECAFFRDADYAVNDEGIRDAVSVRVLPGGQTILASTPWMERGLLYEEFKKNHERPQTALAAHGPTLVLRPAIAELVALETERDHENAAREYGAEFIGSGSDQFFDASLIRECTDPSLVFPRRPERGDMICAGGDFGFRSDSSALAVVHHHAGVILPGELVELRPERGAPLRPSEVVRTFAEVVRAHGCTYLMADSHYRESIYEHLGMQGLGFMDAPAVPAVAYVKARQLMRERRVRLPEHPRFLRQLRDVVARPTSGGGMTIMQPRSKTGGHGDLVSAWVLAVYQASGAVVQDPRAGGAWTDRRLQYRRREMERGGASETERLRAQPRTSPLMGSRFADGANRHRRHSRPL